jgi:hypothetical protein
MRGLRRMKSTGRIGGSGASSKGEDRPMCLRSPRRRDVDS